MAGVAEFTARKGSRSSHIRISIDVVQVLDRSGLSDVFDYRVEIAGIDVTADVEALPSVSESLDPVLINEYRVNEASITLLNKNGKYTPDMAGNFWETNGLNPGGFQNAVKVCTRHFDGNNWIENLLFSGLIIESFEPISEVTFRLNCVDISSQLRNALVQNFGTLQKWDALRRQSDEDNFEGIYVPDRSLQPIQPESVCAWSGNTALTLSRLQLPSEGTAPPNTAYATKSDLRTGGGYLNANPIAKYKTQHRSEDVRFLINQLATNKGVFNTHVDIPGVEVANPFLLNRGSVAFSVENTRVTRLPVDWIHDASNNRILILLSNPEKHISDLLVRYDLNTDFYRVLYVFDKDIKVHQIERRSSTNYYILTSKPISQDRSAPNLPRPIDTTAYAYDSTAADSEIKIYHYNTTSGTLTEHVAEDDTYPPQLGIHYWTGFENSIYVDTFEGIVPSYSDAFKWQSNNLYYRYAKDGEFGVARVNTSGTTTKMMGETNLGYLNYLNFAFDITSTGTIYFAYATGDDKFLSLAIKRRTSGGSETTLFSDNSVVKIGESFYHYLGVHECLYHNNYLYLLCTLQHVDLGEDVEGDADPDFQIIILEEAPHNFATNDITTQTGLNGVSSISPGDDIPIRIDFQQTLSGILQSDLTVRGATITAFSVSSDMIDLTLRPDDPQLHKNITIDIPIDVGDERNDATRILIDFGATRNKTKCAAAVLYRCHVTANTPMLDVLETYDFAQLGACNLIVHDGAVHFIENPPAASKFKPINPDLDGYWTNPEKTQTMGYNLLPENQGQLKRISSSGAVQRLGNLWYTDRPYNIAATRCLSIGRDLHLTMGYGNLDEVLRSGSLASAADNVAHIVYGRTLHYVLPEFRADGSIYDALADIAKKINATLSFEKDIIMIADRSPYRATTDGATGTGTGNLRFENPNKPFPFSGYLLIGKEIMQYTGSSGSAFTGITRGVLNSTIANHVSGTPVIHLDTFISPDSVTEVTRQSDTNRIFNVIRDANGIAEVRDAASIAKYGERPYTLDLGLTRHEKIWVEETFKRYLEELKDLQLLVNLQTVPYIGLGLGQIVPFFYDEMVKPMRIVAIRYEPRATHVTGRTL